MNKSIACLLICCIMFLGSVPNVVLANETDVCSSFDAVSFLVYVDVVVYRTGIAEFTIAVIQ